MGAPDIRNRDDWAPAYRGQEEMIVTPGTPIVFPQPRTVRAFAAGIIVYRDSLGGEGRTSALAAGDDVVGPGDGLVLISEILAATTVTRIQTGRF